MNPDPDDTTPSDSSSVGVPRPQLGVFEGAIAHELEATDVLGPAANWKTVTTPLVLVGDQNHLTVDALTATRYFRLHNPAP